MDHSITVLVADDNSDFGNVLCEYLGNCGDLTVMGLAGDGLETVGMLGKHEPEVLILDLIMPNLDGIGVLERLPDLKLKRKPVIIVLSAIGQDNVIQKAVQLGADYYMIKPFDIDMLVKRIRQLHSDTFTGQEAAVCKTEDLKANPSESEENKLEIIVTDLIRNMGILPNISGFHYLREAVILSVKKPEVLKSPTRSIYPVIAGRHNTSANRVNRAIRNAIENAVTTIRSDRKETTNLKIISSLSGEAGLLHSRK